MQLQLLYNRPDAWAAWEIDYDELTADPRKVVGGPASVSIVEDGPARVALEVADSAYVMETGRVVLDGTAKELAENEDIKEFYLGLTQLGERKSYRDIKHYRRRKRWLG